MKYDVVDGSQAIEETPKFFTIGDLIKLCSEHSDKTFRFVGTEYTVGALHSWRGSYDLPAISYEQGLDLGKNIASDLFYGLGQQHSGWKGGTYKYTSGEEFYVSQQGSSKEYKVCGFKIDASNNEVVLLTKLDPY